MEYFNNVIFFFIHSPHLNAINGPVNPEICIVWMNLDFIGILLQTATLILTKVYNGMKNCRPVYETNDSIYIVQQFLAIVIIKLCWSIDWLCMW